MTVEKDTELEPGQEQTETTTETPAADDGKKAGETPAAAEKQTDEAARHKQQADQERANARRARAALDEAQTENEQLAERLETTQAELAQMRTQLQEQLTATEFKQLADLDPDSTDVPDLVKAFQALTPKVRKLEEENAKMAAFIAEQRTRAQTTAQTEARQQREEELYGACDEEFGAQFRNEAIKLADSWVEDHQVDPPKTWVQGYRLMRKAYAEAAGKHKPGAAPAKKHVPTDTGLRGLSVTEIEDSDEFKPGTLDEVRADMAKKMKAGTHNPKAFAFSP
jgi:uncharacterized protein YhaN